MRAAFARTRLRHVDTEIVSADGTRLIARRTGQGAPVVLVHGSGGGLESWNAIVSLLADEFELWVYARRGYAPSAHPAAPKTFADDAADVAAVVEAVGERAHLVGGSYGATTALHAARAGVATLRSVVLFEPPLFAAGPDLGPVLDEYRALLHDGRYPAAARVFAAKVARVPSALLGPDPGDADPAPDAGRQAEAVSLLHDLEAMVADGTDLARWATVGVPTMVMQGERTWDPMPATMQRVDRRAPRVDPVGGPRRPIAFRVARRTATVRRDPARIFCATSRTDGTMGQVVTYSIGSS